MSAPSCPACGAPAADGARYCRLCGAALGSDADTGVIVPAAGGSVRRDAPSRWWLAGVALAVVLGVGWAAFSSVGDDPAAPATDPASTEDTAPSTTADTEVDDATTRPPPSDTLVVEEGAGPVLGRPVGWSVLVADPYGGAGLWRLDLDTGRLLRYPRVDGAPMAVVGDRLLLIDNDIDDGTAALSVVPLDDPTGPPVSVPSPEQAVAFAVRPAGPGEGDGDAVWVYDFGPGAARWVLLDLGTGQAIDEVVLGDGAGGLVWGAGPELATAGGQGLFRRVGDDYRLVSPGRPMVAVDGDVLMQTCPSPTDCRMTWVDGDSGEVVDHPIPPPGDGALWWQGLVPGSDRFLGGQRTLAPLQTPVVELFDLETGRSITPGITMVGNVTASPDGRLLLMSGASDPTSEMQLAIYDVESGTSYPLAGSPPILNLQAVFVPNG